MKTRHRPKVIDRRWLQRWATRMAKKADVQQPYWFVHNAAGEGGTFCFECGEKRRLELAGLRRQFVGEDLPGLIVEFVLDVLQALDFVVRLGALPTNEHSHSTGPTTTERNNYD